MRIHNLWNKHKGLPIYVIGSGPSMRVLPHNFLRGKITIGINQAWRYGPLTYTLTHHPELWLEYLNTKPRRETTWLVKKKAPLGDISLDDERFYVFNTMTEVEKITEFTPDTLFIGRGGQATGIELAYKMGASEIYLIGCDLTDLNGEHHGHDQHVRFHGLEPDDVYGEMRRSTAKVRRLVPVPVLTITPFIGAGHAGEDYARLCKEKGLDPLPKPQDTSGYKRERVDQ